jgi:ribosomal protein L37AE/L43A
MDIENIDKMINIFGEAASPAVGPLNDLKKKWGLDKSAAKFSCPICDEGMEKIKGTKYVFVCNKCKDIYELVKR